jgi:hypothetical protein
LVKVDVKENHVRVELRKEWKEPDHELLGLPYSGLISRVYETFVVAKGAQITEDNVKAQIAELKEGARVTLRFDSDGKSVEKITADGGAVRGRYLSMNELRRTITVTAGKKEERKVFHLVKETEVIAAGKAARLKDLEESAALLLTLSVEDANTVIRIEPVPPDQGEED